MPHKLLSLTLLAACASKPTPTPAPVAAAEISVECGPPITGADELLRAGGLITFGELHGTREAPAFVADLACVAARSGLKVRVGLEIPRKESPALTRYLAGPGDAAARADLVDGAHWRRPAQDGRSSEATVALIDRIRRLRSAGLDVDMFSFDADAPAPWNERDAAMAEQVLARAAAEPTALILTLNGNLHTRGVVGLPWDPAAVPMGIHLRKRRPDLLSLDLRHTGGTAWVCTPECAPTEMEGAPEGEGRRVVLQPSATSGHDGTFTVGPISAAPPARPDAVAAAP